MLRSEFNTEIIKRSSVNHGRVIKMTTPHGVVETPAFMPVGTRAFVNQLSPFELKHTDTQIILGGNTYHMLINPGLNTIQTLGGMHPFMNWDRPMLTDSGGYQVFSLTQAGLCRTDNTGAHFKHPNSQIKIHLTPELAFRTQKITGADIFMAFDDCVAEATGKEGVFAAMQRTHQWLSATKKMHQEDPNSAYGYYQALFGIVQGGYFQDLREESAQFLNSLDLDGFGIGGESIGPSPQETCDILNWVRPFLQESKIRYPMGVGLGPNDLIQVVAQGADIFDCVAPTRNARHGALYCGRFEIVNDWLVFEPLESNGRLLIKSARYVRDNTPIMPNCQCQTCQNYSRAYLHFLFRQKSSLYYPLACAHNIYVMQETCRRMRNLMYAQTNVDSCNKP